MHYFQGLILVQSKTKGWIFVQGCDPAVSGPPKREKRRPFETENVHTEGGSRYIHICISEVYSNLSRDYCKFRGLGGEPSLNEQNNQILGRVINCTCVRMHTCLLIHHKHKHSIFCLRIYIICINIYIFTVLKYIHTYMYL